MLSQKQIGTICFSKIFAIVAVVVFSTNDSFGACSSGYVLLTGVGTSFMAPVDGSCDVPGYGLLSIPDEYELFYSGVVVGSEITLCSNGRMVDGSCVTYTAGECASGNISLVTNASFVAPVDGKCDAHGYTLKSIENEFTGIYKGVLLGDEVTLCDNGHMSGGTCSSYSIGECPSGYYDVENGDATFGAPSNDTCSNPYSAYNNITRCDHNPGETCVTVPTSTIDINWYDGNDIIHQNTCYYGDNFEVPAAPSRQGYKFNGWIIKN